MKNSNFLPTIHICWQNIQLSYKSLNIIITIVIIIIIIKGNAQHFAVFPNTCVAERHIHISCALYTAYENRNFKIRLIRFNNQICKSDFLLMNTISRQDLLKERVFKNKPLQKIQENVIDCSAHLHLKYAYFLHVCINYYIFQRPLFNFILSMARNFV